MRAGLAAHAEDYAWSSARFRRDSGPDSCAVEMAAWKEEYDWLRWKTVLETSVAEEAFGQRLQEASRRGRPLGEELFVEDLERRCGRRLRSLPVGRPKKRCEDEQKQLGLGFGV